MARQININCDMGEGFGRWTLGDDAGILPLVPTANIATGFHGGDPSIMRRVVGLAKEVGADVGAHVALPDLLGFGRRRIEVSPQELQDYMTYQIGALGAFARAAGTELVRAIHAVTAGQSYVCPEAAGALAAQVLDSGAERNAPHLARREREVLRLISQGMRSQAIGEQLHISVSTVEVHRRNIMRKLGLHTIAELTKYAIREGITSL